MRLDLWLYEDARIGLMKIRRCISQDVYRQDVENKLLGGVTVMEVFILIIAVLLGLAVSGIAYLKYRMVNSSDKKNLEAAIDTEVEKSMKSGLFPGIVVGVCKDGKTLIKGYGVVNKKSSQSPDAETVFQIGSVSKVLTALLLQRLCDEGVVSMDATLDELLGQSIALSPSVRGVTLRQLVTHTSGFPPIPQWLGDKITEMAGDEDLMLDPYSYLSPQYVFDYLASAEGKRKGGRFEYSNYGMGLLAHVLEVVTGEDYESMVKEKVLLPLGMHHTAIDLTPEMKAKLAQGYTGKGSDTGVDLCGSWGRRCLQFHRKRYDNIHPGQCGGERVGLSAPAKDGRATVQREYGHWMDAALIYEPRGW